MKQTIGTLHMSVDIQGVLDFFRRKSMKELMRDDGRPMSDKEVRAELQRHISLGHKLLPGCDERECPDFDYFGGGCPGHDIHYFDNEDKEITKEEYEALMNEQTNTETK